MRQAFRTLLPHNFHGLDMRACFLAWIVQKTKENCGMACQGEVCGLALVGPALYIYIYVGNPPAVHFWTSNAGFESAGE